MRSIIEKYLPLFLILFGIIVFLLSFGPVLYSEAWYYIKQAKGQEFSVNKDVVVADAPGQNTSVFAKFLSSAPVIVNPANTDFAIIIEKIGVNSPVIANVSIKDDTAYTEALKLGVAHAINSNKPSEEPGNTYLFAHASLNFWELGKYATTFNLLRKLELRDNIYIIYKNRLFKYEIVNKEIHEGWNTNAITRPVIEPILTLQTCDPPGTTLNRLVVTAKLLEVKDILVQ